MHESLTCWFLMRFPAIYSAISRPENDGSAKKLSRKSCENGNATRRPQTPKLVRWCPVVRVLSFLFPEDKRAAGWQVFMQNVQRGAQKLKRYKQIKQSPFISIVKHSANGSIGSSVLAQNQTCVVSCRILETSWDQVQKVQSRPTPSGRSAEFSSRACWCG